MTLAQDVEALNDQLAEGLGDLQRARELCALCRRIMHQIVLYPADDEGVQKAYALFMESAAKMRDLAAKTQDPDQKEQIYLRVRNVEMRGKNLDRLRRGKPLELAEKLAGPSGGP